MIFMVFLYKKLFLKKKFAYLPTHKNILTFPETRHLFFLSKPHYNEARYHEVEVYQKIQGKQFLLRISDLSQ